MNKEKNILLIKDFFDRICSKFSNAFLCLEIKDYSNTYIVEITPKDIYDDDEYISMEIDFRSEFEKLNSDASLVFVSEESYVRANSSTLALCVSSPIDNVFTLDYSNKINITNKAIEISANYLFPIYQDNCQEKYQLAA